MNNTIFVSQGMVQGSSMGSWMLSGLAGSWMRSRGELYRDVKSCAERGKRHTQAPYLSPGFSDLGLTPNKIRTYPSITNAPT